MKLKLETTYRDVFKACVLKRRKVEVMSKRKSRNNKEQIVKYESNNFSQEKMIEIQAEAYYRALKRIETEKSKTDEQKPEKKKYKWYENVLFVLNVLFWPWRINKKFNVSNRIYDNILVLFVSGVLKLVGGLMWLFGMFAIIYEIYQLIIEGIMEEIVNVSPVVIFSLFLGSTFVLAGEEFGKETDSNKIYAYSSCIIALISCVLSIIAMIGL